VQQIQVVVDQLRFEGNTESLNRVYTVMVEMVNGWLHTPADPVQKYPAPHTRATVDNLGVHCRVPPVKLRKISTPGQTPPMLGGDLA
jgi:hypothetical protein